MTQQIGDPCWSAKSVIGQHHTLCHIGQSPTLILSWILGVGPIDLDIKGTSDIFIIVHKLASVLDH